ncbi:MAG: hypothetical protein ACP5VR_00080 [Acidimicrobiales bacterium]
MAYLTVEQLDVVVRLKLLEGLATWRRELRIPIECLRMVHVEHAPLDGLSLWRLPGISWPGMFAIGANHRDGVREFAVVRAGQPAVVLDIEGAGWDRVVISHPDAVNLAAELAGLVLGRGPGRRGPKGGRPDDGHGLTLHRAGGTGQRPSTGRPARPSAPIGAACPLA